VDNISDGIRPGEAFPLGATWDGEGTNFAVFSENAEIVDLELFDSPGAGEASRKVRMPEQTAHVWHVYLPGVGPGQLYAYRAHGRYDPPCGLRFNPYKLLLDPYALAVAGELKWDDALFGYVMGDPHEDLSFDDRDSAPFMPKSVVVDPAYDWEGDHLLQVPWSRTVIYETHVKGMTARRPDVPEQLRGTYAGFAAPPVIKYLQDLGVTAVELLPIYHRVDERLLVEAGLVNYWGYNTLAYLAPDSRYSSTGNLGGQVREFKDMVKALHRAGIEVILDVVYNHTAEGNEFGPTLSLRGLDNPSYYHLDPKDLRRYVDFSGCGNSPNVQHPRTLQLITDSLRYWVCEMHVDGFRFDLASVLAREVHAVDRLSAFFDIIQQDPVLSRVKLIAEPWDTGEGGYQVGNFPVLWTEWNGKFRDSVRAFWRGDGVPLGEMAYRLTGSSDLYQYDGRRPNASINLVTCHDGFTLADLVSYEKKHNDANPEKNNSGTDHNLSMNCGVEGPTDDPEVLALRARQRRNFLVTLFLSQGVPMLLGGDEIFRSLDGNNNAYCQDNELSWLDGELSDEKKAMLEFTRRLIALRREHPVFRRRKFFQGRPIAGKGVKDITWLLPDGREPAELDWRAPGPYAFGMLLSGDAIGEMDRDGRHIQDDTFVIILNATAGKVPFKLPASEHSWEVVLHTLGRDLLPVESRAPGGAEFPIEDRSVFLLRRL
jgi:glycogen operon protein